MFVGHWPGRLGPVDDIRRGCVRTAYTYRGCARIGPMCVWNKSLGLFVPRTFARRPELQNSRRGWEGCGSKDEFSIWQYV